MVVEIKQVGDTLPIAALDELLAASRADGFKMIGNLIDRWEDGSNRFNKTGEALFLAVEGDKIVGVCGRNVDPYLGDDGAARVRRLYVLPAFRRQGIAHRLMKKVMDVPAGAFKYLTLRTDTPEGFALYKSLGFELFDHPKVTHRFNLPEKE